MTLPVRIRDQIDVILARVARLLKMHRQRAGFPRKVWLFELEAMPRDANRARTLSKGEGRSVQYRMSEPKPNQELEESEQICIGLAKPPIEPAGLIVLTVRVVVSELRSPDLIFRENHRAPSGDEKKRGEVSRLAPA